MAFIEHLPKKYRGIKNKSIRVSMYKAGKEIILRISVCYEIAKKINMNEKSRIKLSYDANNKMKIIIEICEDGWVVRKHENCLVAQIPCRRIYSDDDYDIFKSKRKDNYDELDYLLLDNGIIIEIDKPICK